jgi:hypothetical protein
MIVKTLICTDKYSSLLVSSETNVTQLHVVMYQSVEERGSEYGLAEYVNATQNLKKCKIIYQIISWILVLHDK